MERFWDILQGRADSRRLGALAMETGWRLAAATENGVLVDAVFDRRRGDVDHILRGLEIAGSPEAVEVWCAVPPTLARDRYIARSPTRSPAHPPWSVELDGLGPLGGWPVVRVDTTTPVDVGSVVAEIRSALR